MPSVVRPSQQWNTIPEWTGNTARMERVIASAQNGVPKKLKRHYAGYWFTMRSCSGGLGMRERCHCCLTRLVLQRSIFRCIR